MCWLRDAKGRFKKRDRYRRDARGRFRWRGPPITAASVSRMMKAYSESISAILADERPSPFLTGLDAWLPDESDPTTHEFRRRFFGVRGG